MAFENMLNPALALAQMTDPLGAMNQQRAADTSDQAQQTNIASAQQAQQLQAQQTAQAQARAAARDADVQAALANPTPAAFAALQAKYPEDQAAFKSSWELRDKAARTADLTSLGGIVAAIDAGRPELALQAVNNRHSANGDAGVDQPIVGMLRDALQNGDTAKAKGLASYMIASATGDPDKLNELVNPKAGESSTVVSAGGALVDKKTGAVLFKAGDAPHYEKVKDADGNEQIVQVGGSDAKGGSVGAGGFTNFYGGFLAPTEGGYAARDGKSGAPVNYGVNQAANPDIDVSKLTPAAAAKIMHDRYWVPSGADNIPDPALQAVHADTAVNMGVATAKQMLAASGGDVNKYLGLRAARYKALGGPDLPAWQARNAKLADFVGATPGGAASNAKVVYSTPSAPDNGLMGRPYLDSLPPAKRGIISAIVRGDFPITSKMTSPSTIKLFEDAARVDPSISAATYPKRAATMKDFSTSGKSGQAITSIETITNHLHRLADLSDKIGGVDAWVLGKPINSAINVGKGMSNNPDLIAYNDTVAKLAPEIDKFLSGKAATVSGTHEAASSYNPNNGPAGRKAAIANAIELITGRLGPLGDAFSRGMDKNVDGAALMQPKVAARLKAVQAWAGGGQLDAETSATAATSHDPAKIAALRAKFGLR